jgi:hypothetical protein
VPGGGATATSYPITVAQQELAHGLAYIAAAVADTAREAVD